MRILLVTTNDYLHHPLPSRHHHIFEELAARGHDIYVPHFHVSDGEARKTNLHVIEATKVPSKDPMLHYLLNAPYHHHVFDQAITKYDIDVVVASHILAGTAAIHAAKLHGVRVVYDLKDWYPSSAEVYYTNPAVKFALRTGVWKVLRHNLRHSDVITTVSPSLAARLFSKKFFSVEVIPNGVDTVLFRPLEKSKCCKELHIGISEQDFIIGYVGAIERWLDFKTLIEALQWILPKKPRAKLLIVGDALFTSQMAELRQLITMNGLDERVIFTGKKPYDTLPQYIGAMDICTIPMGEVMRDIALPNKYFEYAACGKPILSTPIPDIIKVAGKGVFFYDSAEEFADIVLSLDSGDYICEPNGGCSWVSRADDFERVLKRYS